MEIGIAAIATVAGDRNGHCCWAGCPGIDISGCQISRISIVFFATDDSVSVYPWKIFNGCLFLFITGTLPQLLLYLFAVLLSPDASVVAYTWDLPVRVVIASAAMIIPTTLLALMLSSLTIESRFATFGWFFIWIFGLAAFLMMRGMNGDTSELVLRLSFLFLLFSDISTAILGIPTLESFIQTQLVFVVVLSLVCFTVIFRKVSAPLRA